MEREKATVQSEIGYCEELFEEYKQIQPSPSGIDNDFLLLIKEKTDQFKEKLRKVKESTEVINRRESLIGHDVSKNKQLKHLLKST